MKKIEYTIIKRGDNKTEPLIYNQPIDNEIYKFITNPPTTLDGLSLISDKISDQTYDLQEEHFSLCYEILYDILDSQLGIPFEDVKDGDMDFNYDTIFFDVYI
jgi:hypothetical protein